MSEFLNTTTQVVDVATWVLLLLSLAFNVWQAQLERAGKLEMRLMVESARRTRSIRA